MKKLKIILFLFFLLQVCFSQTIRFNKTYSGYTPGLRNIEIVDDGYISLGFDKYYGYLNIFILKIDLFGDTIWTKHYGDTIYDY